MGQTTEESEGAEHRKYVIRKLCSGIEEYEASTRERLDIDLSSLEKDLISFGLTDVFINGLQLTVLLEDLETTAKIYPSGVIHLLANNKEECEKACEIIYSVIQKNLESNVEHRI
ncbi:MAG: hypothetical protein WC375_00995 [Methanomassiliicoccales archaeon]|jgi:hypothetical protein